MTNLINTTNKNHPSSDFDYEYTAQKSKTRPLFLLKELWGFRDLIWLITKRDIFARYKRSFLGIFWSLLEPLGIMVVMAVIFSVVLRQKIENFPVFLFSGLITWQFFSQSTITAMEEIRANGPLMSKVYIPGGVFIISSVFSSLVQFFFGFIVLLFILLVTQYSITWNLFFIPIALMLISTFNIGIGLFLGTLAVFFSDVRNIYNIVLRALLYGSAVFYEIQNFPELTKKVIEMNPVYQMIELVRYPIYYQALPPISIIFGATIFAVVAFLIGVSVFAHYSSEFGHRN